MADQNDQNPPEPVQQPGPTTPQRANQQAIIDVATLVESRQADETVLGGRFLVNGVYVDADGNKHKDQKSE